MPTIAKTRTTGLIILPMPFCQCGMHYTIVGVSLGVVVAIIDITFLPFGLAVEPIYMIGE